MEREHLPSLIRIGDRFQLLGTDNDYAKIATSPNCFAV
jgi:hypothetical protein